MTGTQKIHPVILCGGSGTRLWPQSRTTYPKQFAALLDDESLFQKSLRRCTGPDYAPPLVVTSDTCRFIAQDQLDEAGVTASAIVIEPEARNTAPAILAAALSLAGQGHGRETVMLVVPSDHVIPNEAAFRDAVLQGLPAVQAGRIVTFGITPTKPETGYGYLEIGVADATGVTALKRFVEKPDLQTAARFVTGGNHLWNAGIFLFQIGTLLDSFAAHCPEMLGPVTAAVEGARQDLGFTRLDAVAWQTCPAESIDFAVMEKASNLSVVRYSEGWSDLGDWDALLRETITEPDTGNALHGDVTAIDCQGTLLRATVEGQRVVGLGLTDHIVVAMTDAVLVAKRSDAQRVKQVVELLRAQQAPQSDHFTRDHRPWGWFESLIITEYFQVKRIVVKPGGKLSLQSHKFRAEHWIVVEGVATVTIEDVVKDVCANESVHIPLGAKHRMANQGDTPMVLIEVQTGTYFGEDDIFRYEDVYARN